MEPNKVSAQALECTAFHVRGRSLGCHAHAAGAWSLMHACLLTKQQNGWHWASQGAMPVSPPRSVSIFDLVHLLIRGIRSCSFFSICSNLIMYQIACMTSHSMQMCSIIAPCKASGCRPADIAFRHANVLGYLAEIF